MPCTDDCPSGSSCGGTVCIYDASSECVVEPLGHEASFALDTVLSGVPAAIEQVNYLVAPGSYADALSANSLALGWLSGFSAERHSCVADVAAPATTVVPRLDTFEAGLTPSGLPIAVGFAVSDSQIDHALWAAHRAGAFCSVDPSLDSGELVSFAPSLAGLASGDVPLEVRVTPMVPPTATIGSGEYIEDPPGEIAMVSPLVTLHLTDWVVEIYALLFDRYVRVLVATVTADVEIGLGATAAGDLISVVGDDATITTLTVTESELLTESPVELEVGLPAMLGPMLRDLVAAAAGPVPEPSLFGVPVNVKDVVGYTSDQMVGVFGALEVTP